MSKKSHNNIAKQGAILAAAALIVRFIGFLYRMPLTDIIEDDGNAYYGAAFAIYNFFFVVSSYGVPIALSKMMAERIAKDELKNANQVFKVALYFCIVTGGISSLILWIGNEWIASTLYNMSGAALALKALAPTIFIVSLLSAFRGFFQGMNTMKPTAVSQIIEQIFNAIFSIVMAWLLISYGVAYGAAGGTLGTGIGALFGFIFIMTLYLMYRKTWQKRVEEDATKVCEDNKVLMKKFLGTVIPIAMTTAIFSIVTIVDTSMFNNLMMRLGYEESKVASEIGRYLGKYIVLTNLPISLATALATAFVPGITVSALKNSLSDLEEKANTALTMTMVIGAPASVGLTLLGVPIVHLLFPAAPEGGELLTIGAFSIMFFSILQICSGILQGLGYIKRPARNVAIGAGIKVVLNLIFLYGLQLGITGLIMSMVIFGVIVSALNLHDVVKLSKIKVDIKHVFVKPIISSLFMGLYTWFIYILFIKLTQNNMVACLTSLIVSVLAYFICLININGISDEEILRMPMGRYISKLKFAKRN